MGIFILIIAGSTITSTDILGYFVWVPRYKYKIPTGGTATPSSIDIVFENRDTDKSTGNATTEYFTPPGFTFGSDELNGIWVAKFETTGSPDEPTVLPNVTSLRSQNIRNQFATALKFNNYISSYDAHMMKNTEWAAVTYLSHSKYGINADIRINNNSGYTTGCGALEPNDNGSLDCQIEYGSGVTKLPQSTTDNITGIFDMSGGSYEKVMGNLNNAVASSGFDEMPDAKYYDSYSTDSYLTACNGPCLGHANIETKDWYTNHHNCFYMSNTWIDRGGYFANSNVTGAFYTGINPGNAAPQASFRVTIA